MVFATILDVSEELTEELFRSDELVAEDATHGALHLYRAERPFNYREVRFCQALFGSSEFRFVR